MRKHNVENCDPVGPYIRRQWERVRTVTPTSSESRTSKSLGDDTNVNKIVARFSRTGIMPQPTRPAVYADVTHLQQLDLTQLIENAREAKTNLEQLNEEKNRRLKEAQENAKKQETKNKENATKIADEA